MSDWFDKYKDVRWQRLRDKIRIRDDYTCQFCGSKDQTVNVHHVHYSGGENPWDYSDDDLITLCEPCHKETTKRLLMVRKSIGGDWDMLAAVCRFLGAWGAMPPGSSCFEKSKSAWALASTFAEYLDNLAVLRNRHYRPESLTPELASLALPLLRQGLVQAMIQLEKESLKMGGDGK